MENNNWISVKDKLPKTYTEVLAWVNNKEYPIIATWDGTNWSDNIVDYTNWDITHWQPLPEPPKQLPPIDNEIK